jgi:hypothetical protein
MKLAEIVASKKPAPGNHREEKVQAEVAEMASGNCAIETRMNPPKCPIAGLDLLCMASDNAKMNPI